MHWSLILLFLIGQCCFIDCHLYEYRYINEKKTWTEAQQYCREKHTDLATVTNMTDMKRLSISRKYQSNAWIGLYDQKDVNRTWYWSLPGVEFNESETNWESKEPTDKGNPGTPENCGSVYQNLEWIDTGCQNTYFFFCYDETNRTHKYHLIRDQKTWQEAQRYCREKHTDLISGLKQLQDEELKKVKDSTDSYPYIGLFRDTWRWSDGSSFSFRHWEKKLNNTKYNSDRCTMIGFDDEGRWKNASCTETKPFICYDDKVILIKENKTWEEALYYCRDHYRDLVTITNLDEQRWVQEKAKNASTDYVWMGLIYACTLDLWFWVSDQLVSYKNWASDDWMDDCDMSGAMETGGKHQWRKKGDHYKFNFLCSKN